MTDTISREAAIAAVTEADRACLGANGARDAIRALPPAQGSTGWRDIADAPQDGTWFLACGLDGGTGPGRHMAIVMGDGAGFFDDYDEYTYLTHWMPLPAPPVDSSAAPSTPVDNKISADPVGKEG